jgi:hypothetical protein
MLEPRIALSAVSTLAAAAVGAWLGWVPPGAHPGEPTAVAARAPADPEAAAPARCAPARPPGLRRPTSSRVDPELDPELVGVPSAWPEQVPKGFSEAELRALLGGPGVTFDCSEWPCIVEQHAADSTPDSVGDTPLIDDALKKLQAAGLEVDVRASISGVRSAEGAEEVMVLTILPKAEQDPAVTLRTAVRQLWTEEAVRQ